MPIWPAGGVEAGCRMAPRSRGPPRLSASRDSARGMSGSCRAGPHARRRSSDVLGDEPGHRVEPPVPIAVRIGQRRHQPLRQQSRRRRRSPCGRWSASRPPLRSPDRVSQQFQVDAGRRVDEQRRAGGFPFRPPAAAAVRRAASFRHRRCTAAAAASFGARDRCRNRPASRRRKTGSDAGLPRCRCRTAPPAAARRWRRSRSKAGRSVPRRGTPRSATISSLGIDPHDIGNQPAGHRLGEPERARRNIRPGEREAALAGAFDPRERHQIVGFGWREQLSSVSVPGVTRRMTSRRTTAFEPRFLAAAGSSVCSHTATR